MWTATEEVHAGCVFFFQLRNTCCPIGSGCTAACIVQSCIFLPLKRMLMAVLNAFAKAAGDHPKVFLVLRVGIFCSCRIAVAEWSLLGILGSHHLCS